MYTIRGNRVPRSLRDQSRWEASTKTASGLGRKHIKDQGSDDLRWYCLTSCFRWFACFGSRSSFVQPRRLHCPAEIASAVSERWVFISEILVWWSRTGLWFGGGDGGWSGEIGGERDERQGARPRESGFESLVRELNWWNLNMAGVLCWASKIF